MPAASPKQKSAYELRQELAAAEKRETEEAKQTVIDKFRKEYEGKYFWFKREFKALCCVGIARLYKFEFDVMPDGMHRVRYQRDEIRMCHANVPIGKWDYDNKPMIDYEHHGYCGCNTFEVPPEYVTKTRDASKAEFQMLKHQLAKITAENLAMFSGEIVVPDLEPDERRITTGQL